MRTVSKPPITALCTSTAYACWRAGGSHGQGVAAEQIQCERNSSSKRRCCVLLRLLQWPRSPLPGSMVRCRNHMLQADSLPGRAGLWFLRRAMTGQPACLTVIMLPVADVAACQPAVGKPDHRISQTSAMSDHVGIKHFAFGCYEL